MHSAVVFLLAAATTIAAVEEIPIIKLTAKTEEQIISYPDPNCKTKECIWRIETDETKVVFVEVLDGKLEETTEECTRSSLEAFDGPTLKAARVNQLCVKMEAEVRTKPHHCMPSTGKHLMLRFHQHPDDMKHTFKLRYLSVPREEDACSYGRRPPPHHGGRPWPPHHGGKPWRPHHGGHEWPPHRPHHGGHEFPHHGSDSSEERTDRFENGPDPKDCDEHMSKMERKMRGCRHHHRRLDLIVGVGVGAFGILILTVIAAVCCRKRSRQVAKMQQKREKQRQFINALGVYQVTLGDEKKAPLQEPEVEPAALEKVDLKLNPDFFNTPPPYTDIDKLEEKLLV